MCGKGLRTYAGVDSPGVHSPTGAHARAVRRMENFEEIKARIDEHKDDFEDIKKSVGDLTDKLKDVKEGWHIPRRGRALHTTALSLYRGPLLEFERASVQLVVFALFRHQTRRCCPATAPDCRKASASSSRSRAPRSPIRRH